MVAEPDILSRRNKTSQVSRHHSRKFQNERRPFLCTQLLDPRIRFPKLQNRRDGGSRSKKGTRQPELQHEGRRGLRRLWLAGTSIEDEEAIMYVVCEDWGVDMLGRVDWVAL
jgi:hypothetical protein